jgi:peroxiredoxin
MTRALLLAALVTVAGAGASAATLEVGQQVPDFAGRSLDGTSFTLREAVGAHRAVVVVFLSTVCPYARAFGPHLQDLQQKYGAGVLILGVNSNRTETAEEVRADALRRGLTFPIVKDEGLRVADALGARVTPESFLIDAAGRLRYRGRVRSKIGQDDLKNALDEVLGGRSVKVPVAKVFGCALQRD